MIVIPDGPRPSIDDYDHAVAEQHHPGSAAFDANGYLFPSGCSYAPVALENSAPYQELIGKSCDATVAAGQAAAFIRAVSEARDYVRAVGLLPVELEQVRESTLRALGAAIGRGMRTREEADAVRNLARAGMRKLQEEYRQANARPDSKNLNVDTERMVRHETERRD